MKPDKNLIRLRFGRKLAQYNNLASVQQGIATELGKLYRIHFPDHDAKRVYEPGAGTGFLTYSLKAYHPDAEFFLNDLVEQSEDYLSRIAPGPKTHYIWGDAETVEFPGELDLVASASTIQWFDDLGSFLKKAAASTVSGGALALSTFGPDNFREVRMIKGFGLDYSTKSELGKLVEDAGYEILHLTEQTRTLYFDIPVDVVYHIRTTGVNALQSVGWNRQRLEIFNKRYRELFMTRDGLIPLTYHPIFIIARKK